MSMSSLYADSSRAVHARPFQSVYLFAVNQSNKRYAIKSLSKINKRQWYYF